jgi:hypothetical protein
MRKVLVVLLALTFAIAPLLTFVQPVQATTASLTIAGEGSLTGGTYFGGAADYTVLNSDDGNTSYWYYNGTLDRTWTASNLAIAGTITAVTLYVKADLNSGSGTIQPLCRISGTNYYGTQQNLVVNTYNTFSKSWTVNPNTLAAWSVAEINSTEWGQRTVSGGASAVVTYAYITVDYTAAVPTVTTQAVSGNGYTAPNYIATLNGTITATGGLTPNYRGFVWSTSTHGDPGNVAPVASAYSDNWTETGSFIAEAFSHQVTSFTGATAYYVRSVAHNSLGWAYGNEVTFTTLSAPTITTQAASMVSFTTARLNGTVTLDGGQLADVRFAYDNVSAHAVFTDYANITAWVTDNYSTGDNPYVDITGLTGATLYHCKVQIRNDVASADGADLTFTTANGVLKPTNVSVIPASTSVSLSWTKGSGALYTLARYKLAAYPATNIDGTSAYLGTGNSVSITGLTPGLTYYISLWGFTSGTYSVDYATGLGTTLAYDAPGTGTGNAIEVPADGGTFTQTPDTVHVTNVPFHEAIESISTAYGTPLNMVWYVIWMMAGIAGGILLYNRAGQGGQASYNLPMTFGAEAIWFGIGASIGLTMMWVVVLFLIVATGFTMFGNRH